MSLIHVSARNAHVRSFVFSSINLFVLVCVTCWSLTVCGFSAIWRQKGQEALDVLHSKAGRVNTFYVAQKCSAYQSLS